jgi:hypothetical protein
MRVKDVRISEQTAYQLVQFLRRYRLDVEHLMKQASEDGGLVQYLEAMHYGDCDDAARLEQKLIHALERRDHPCEAP